MRAACRQFLSIFPNITRQAIGTRMMPTHSMMLVQAFGFSNGWAELAPKKPPPLVPNCLTATMAATGPRATACVCGWPLASTSSVVTWALGCMVMGMPAATSSQATMRQSGTKK